MPAILIFTPGSASLKFEVIEVAAEQVFASLGKKLVSASIEEIGNAAELLVFNGRDIAAPK